jgi:hypothetical protein
LRRRSVIELWQSGQIPRCIELQQGDRVAFEDVNDTVRALRARHPTGENTSFYFHVNVRRPEISFVATICCAYVFEHP